MGRDNGRYGGEARSGTYAVGKVHGSMRHPVDYGGSVWWTGANSAGAVHFIAGGTLTLNGSIVANGTGGSTCGSAGGSVWIECAEFAGTGSIRAIGGVGSQDYSGSGGRIAIRQTATSGWTSFTGSYTTAHGTTASAAGGTLYLEDASDTPGEGTLIVDNSNNTKNSSQYIPLNFDMVDGTNVLGRVVLRNRGRLRVVSGLTLKVTKGIEVAANCAVLTEAGGAIEFVGSEDATVTGGSRITVESLICTNAGKTIRFGTAAADKLTIPLGKSLILRGEPGNPVTLASTTEGTRWPIAVNANAGLVDVANVAVKDSDASSGAGILAIDSTDLGNNLYWGFSAPIAPGAAIEWTGAADTAWQNPANWNPARTPVDTDVITIPSVASAKYPVLGAGTFLFNRVSVGAGASLTFSGPTVTVTNSLVVAGALGFSGAETLYLYGNADFSGGSIVPASCSIVAVGSAAQTLDFGGLALNILTVSKSGGSVSFGAHGFSAVSLNCTATCALGMTFAAGEEVAVDKLNLLGAIGGVPSLTLSSSVPGTAWRLVVAADGANVGGVVVSDSDASGGEKILAGTTSVGVSNNSNWDFTTDVALWVGGASGQYTSGANWSTGAVPDDNTIVKIVAGDGETATITLASGNTAAMRSLKVLAGTGGSAKFIANGAVTVADLLEIGANGTVELNAYNDTGAAPNTAASVHVKSGGVLTHAKGGTAETAKIHLSVSGNVTVDSGGSISATGKGYQNGSGPGGGAGNMTGAGYASYSYSGKAPYGSILRPVNWGSASGRNFNGGGAIHLVVAGTLAVNGTVEADGQPDSASSGVYGSCGGSVWIECASLTGSGYVTARDSFIGGSRISADTKGSGGRIAVYQRQATDFSDFPKSRILTQRMTYATPGTVYLESADTSSGTDLYVIGTGNNTSLKTVFPMPADGSDYSIYTNLNIHVGIASFLSIGRLTGGAPVEVRSLSVENTGMAETVAGCDLSVRSGLSIASNSSLASAGGDDLVFSGAEDATLYGLSRISGFAAIVCTNAGKALLFGSAANDTLTVEATSSLLLEGTAAEPVRLWPVDALSTWQVNLSSSAASSVKYVSVSNSNASAGTTVLAIDSTDLGGNNYWSFSTDIEPGETIVWTGGVSTDWTDGANWDRGRVPVETDDVVIERAGEFDPTLSSGTYLFNRVRIRPNAALTLDGATLTVTNLMLNSGTLEFAGAETLYLTGDAFFTNGTVVAAQSYVRIAGSGAQTIDFGNTSVGKVYVENPVGPINFAGHGFAAKSFNCAAASSVVMRFEPGALYDFEQCYVNSSDAGASITLASRSYGSRWRLKVYENATGFGRVAVSDCDASAGEVAYAGRNSADEGNNVNWDFSTDVAVWTGGASGDFDDAANWSSGAVPSNSTHVAIIAGDGAAVAVTIQAASSASVGTLVLGAGTGGSASLLARGPIVVAGDAEVRTNCTLTLNAYNDTGAAPNVISNDFRVCSGGRVTHSGPATTENAKIHLAVLGDMTVAAGAKVTADSKGYGSGYSPAGYEDYMHGAVHAGYANTTLCEPYGSIFRPVNWGAAPSYVAGGGAIHLVVSGELVVDGSISAEGTSRSNNYGGCGGSVWLECASLTGSGIVSAREGVSANINADYSGSGGRVAVYQRAARDFSAFPKSRILATAGSLNSCGTVYLEGSDPARGCNLYIESGQNVSSYATLFPMAADGDAKTAYQNVNLIIGRGGWVKVARGEGNVPQKIRLRSLWLSSASSKLDLNANFFEVYDPEWKRGRDWSPSATLIPGTYNRIDGEVIWLSRGSRVILR
ncbi:MAG: hypothetical protein IJG70_04245 [Kiritimatiellae bacterium]|nr:hypothetical protein [Kiritimatiellia bacterium]